MERQLKAYARRIVLMCAVGRDTIKPKTFVERHRLRLLVPRFQPQPLVAQPPRFRDQMREHGAADSVPCLVVPDEHALFFGRDTVDLPQCAARDRLLIEIRDEGSRRAHPTEHSPATVGPAEGHRHTSRALPPLPGEAATAQPSLRIERLTIREVGKCSSGGRARDREHRANSRERQLRQTGGTPQTIPPARRATQHARRRRIGRHRRRQYIKCLPGSHPAVRSHSNRSEDRLEANRRRRKTPRTENSGANAELGQATTSSAIQLLIVASCTPRRMKVARHRDNFSVRSSEIPLRSPNPIVACALHEVSRDRHARAVRRPRRAPVETSADRRARGAAAASSRGDRRPHRAPSDSPSAPARGTAVPDWVTRVSSRSNTTALTIRRAKRREVAH